MDASGQKTSNELAEERTDLASMRNVMAADRTLMAWVRTSLAMTSFGFTIYKLLQALQQSGAVLPHEHTPRRIGLFLTGLGTVAIVMGAIEYRQALRALHDGYGVRIWRASFIMALIMSLLGTFLFVSIWSKFL
ncbi:MAG: DUF202 domain-containing protein [Pseudomonadota bacterium]